MRFEAPLRILRDHLVGESGRFVLEARRHVTLPAVEAADVYIHIPFCKSLCPYCPYNRVLYEAAVADRYTDALLCEIDAFREALGPIDIGSVYVGGGTPTTMLGGLGSALRHIKTRFAQEGPIAVESIPSDLDQDALHTLAEQGVSQLSIGVQSFDDRYLKLIGRPYRGGGLDRVITDALAVGFDTVNVDLMFALPGQTTAEALADLDRAIDLGVDQVTMYPLFTFPYSAAGRHLHLHGVRFPSFRSRRVMYRALHDRAISRGLRRSSVWSFSRDDDATYSSVTRERFIGLGAGSATCLPGIFYFNTFSVPEYMRVSGSGELPVALAMRMSEMMEAWYWLYWRLYETAIQKRPMDLHFHGNGDVRRMLWLARLLGFATDEGDAWRLTERGAFWIHLLQNHVVLNYIDSVWTAAMRAPWPGRIRL